MSEETTKVITTLLNSLEREGEIVPGSAEHLSKSFRTSGDVVEDVADTFSFIYGKPSVTVPARDGEPASTLPEVPPCPFLSPARKSKSQTILGTVVKVMSPLLAKPTEDADLLQRKLVALSERDSFGEVGGAIARHLYEDRSNWVYLANGAKPPLPPAESTARKRLEAVRHWFDRNADLAALARRWSDVGASSVSETEARKRIAARLKDPDTASRYCRRGETPEFKPEDLYPGASQASLDAEKALIEGGKYNF